MEYCEYQLYSGMRKEAGRVRWLMCGCVKVCMPLMLVEASGGKGIDKFTSIGNQG